VLLLDEPRRACRRQETERILQLLEKLPSEIAILIIEHDMDLVFRFARRITVLCRAKCCWRARRRKSRATARP